MGDELRAAENYGAKNTASSMRARLQARQAAMVEQFGSKDGALVALDVQLRALLGDAAAQGLPVVDFADFKDYLIFTRQIFKADARLEMNTLRREFGAMCAFWTSRGLLYPWLCRIGYVIFGIMEDEMDHALLTHLAFNDAGHSGFSPAAGGTPAASAPGDTGEEGASSTPAKTDHKHGREAFGTGAGSVCQGNDARLSNARTPTSHGNDKHNFLGSSFPSSPATNDIYYHTTYGEWFFFDGTRWLSVCVRSCTLNDTRVQPNNDSLLQAAAPRQPSGLDFYVIAMDWSWVGDTIQSGTKYITYTLTREPSGTGIASFNTQTGTSANVWIGGRVPLTALTGTSDICLALTASRTSTPGSGTVTAAVRYRLVGV